MKKELLVKASVGGGLWVVLLYAVEELLHYNGRLHCIIVLIMLGILGNKLNSKSMKSYMYGVSICHLVYMYFEPPMRNYFWAESSAHFGGGWETDWLMIVVEVIIVICMTIMPIAVKDVRREIKGTDTEAVNDKTASRQETASKQMRSVKESPQSVSDIQKYGTPQYSQQLQMKQTNQEFTQNAQDSAFKTKQEHSTSAENVVVSTGTVPVESNNSETESSHDSQDKGQYDVGVDALNQFVQGLK